MKKKDFKLISKNSLIVLGFIFMAVNIYSQDIKFTIENSQNTVSGSINYYEADIVIETSTDFKLGSGQLYLNYNTYAFGDNISSNGKIQYTQPAGSILGEVYGFPAYKDFIQNDNTNSRVSLSFQQGISSGTITSNNVSATPKKLFHIKIEYANVNISPLVDFETESIFLDQFYTACGSEAPGFPNCTDFPGTQLLNDTFLNLPSDDVINDPTDPDIVGTVPADDDTGVTSSNLQIIFNEDVQKGTGDILIKRVSNDEVVGTIPISGSGVTIDNTANKGTAIEGTVTINISSNLTLPSNTDLYIEIPDTAFKDLSSNPFPGFSDDTSWNFTTDVVLGIDKILDNMFYIYPNPVLNSFAINSSNNAIKKVEIYSVLGKMLKTVNKDFKYINTNRLPVGIYMVRVYSENGVAVKKLIKR